MTQVGEGHEAEGSRPIMTFGVPTVGEVLADRYRLEEHINDDAVGRQVWRGIDVILRRPVAVVLRYPGGDSAIEMLDAAVSASRVVHPNLVGVYDAIDEGDRAYVVREWVEGAALREYATHTPLDADRATAVGSAVAAATAAMHATGMVHGNIHPGTVLIAADGRVVLADARIDDHASVEADIRAIGGVLYYALTGHWPQAEAGRTNLPDAMRDAHGMLASPRQIRGGVPAYLDEIVTDLLDTRLTLPSADVLAAELGRLNATMEAEAEEQYEDSESPLGFGAIRTNERPRPAGRKLAVGIAALVFVATTGLLVGAKMLSSTGASGGPPSSITNTTPGAATSNESEPRRLPLTAAQIRIVDPKGDRDEIKDEDLIVDDKVDTGWKTARYRGNPAFGGLKSGMGVLIDLGGKYHVVGVEVQFSAAGASAEMRVGQTLPPATSAGDAVVVGSYTRVGEPVDKAPVTHNFIVDGETQYLMLWISKMPQIEDGRYQIGVQEIAVHVR
ncbi:MAG TPA: protein kinase family protein [Micromonosporaceae bacterium]|nr:protein kinase family protein [Micromonosporaceae bacterium]